MKLSTSVLASVAIAISAVNALVVSHDDYDSSIVQGLIGETPRSVVVFKSSKIFRRKHTEILESVLRHHKQGHEPILITNNEKIPHRYMVIFKQGLAPEEITLHKENIQAEQFNFASQLFQQDPEHGFFQTIEDSIGGILHSFHLDGVFSGYTGYFLDSTIELLKNSPLVDFVEQDSTVTIKDYDIQIGAPWGLARISHRGSLGLGSHDKYLYDDEGGKDTLTYVIDTGVLDTHEDFEGRAKLIADIPNDGLLDGHGHGTHCSGTVGSKTYGVAKKVNIRGVKVLGANGTGPTSDIVKGVEVATKDFLAEIKKNPKLKGASANMSLGGFKSKALDNIINASSRAGLVFAVAAGNDNQDACDFSPAAAELAITVGASTISDSRAYFSNWGRCVDIFAPGLNILSTFIGNNKATLTGSGTSMASPHVAGLLAYFISLSPPLESGFSVSKRLTPAQLKKNLISFATYDKLTDIGTDSPNILAFNGAGKQLTDFFSQFVPQNETYIQNEFSELFKELGAKMNS